MADTPRRLVGILVILTLVLGCAPAFAAPTFPALSGRVVDEAHLLNPADEQALTAELKALEEKSSDQVVVVTLPSLQGYSIEDYGYQLGRHWGIGTKQLSNGVLLIIAPNERKVRIEVGRGLEPVLTDALSKIVIENAILPRFRSGDFTGGIKDGVGDITKVLTGDAAEVEQRAKARQVHTRDPDMDWTMVVFWTVILLWFIWTLWRSSQTPAAAGRYGGPIVIPGPGWGRGGFSGGGFGGGGFGGGGFSGGGGGFGGGGASGGW